MVQGAAGGSVQGDDTTGMHAKLLHGDAKMFPVLLGARHEPAETAVSGEIAGEENHGIVAILRVERQFTPQDRCDARCTCNDVETDGSCQGVGVGDGAPPEPEVGALRDETVDADRTLVKAERRMKMQVDEGHRTVSYTHLRAHE